MTEVALGELRAGTVVRVRTRNTVYAIEKRPRSRAVISGSRKYCPEPVELFKPWVYIRVGYPMILRLRRKPKPHDVQTTPVQSIEIDALATELNQRFN